MVDILSTYRDKRDFKKTGEPSGEAQVKPSNRRRFVIQKRDATDGPIDGYRHETALRKPYEAAKLAKAIARAVPSIPL